MCNDGNKAYIKYDIADEVNFGACHVAKAEEDYISQFSRSREKNPLASQNIYTGLALSGGGIRSASFCLGVMQALAHAGWLKNIDYLSTVSGGGYLGSCVNWLLHKGWDDPNEKNDSDEKKDKLQFGVCRENFPLGTYPIAGSEHNKNGDKNQVKPRYKGSLLRYLRQHSSYLTPGDGIDGITLFAVMLRNSLLSVLTYGGLLVLVMLLFIDMMSLVFNSDTMNPVFDSFIQYSLIQNVICLLSGMPHSLWPLMVILALFILSAFLYPIITLFFSREAETTGYKFRILCEYVFGKFIWIAIAFAVIGSLPIVEKIIEQRLGDGSFKLGSSTILIVIGVALSLKLFLDTSSIKKSILPEGLLAGFASFFILYGVLISVCAALQALNGLVSEPFKFEISTLMLGVLASLIINAVINFKKTFWIILLASPIWIFLISIFFSSYVKGDFLITSNFADLYDAGIKAEYDGQGHLWKLFLAVTVVTAYITNVNYTSLFSYYRDRLMEVFMPDVTEVLKESNGKPNSIKSADHTQLYKLKGTKEKHYIGPFHIINTNVVLVSSKEPKFRARGGDNFILTPLYCGSNATGWCDTEASSFKDMTYATAMAISGAAVNPNTGIGGEGVTRQRLVSMLMGILNLRLGYWTDNPMCTQPKCIQIPWLNILGNIPNTFHPGLSELFGGSNLDENRKMLLLTDGGHFENLGLYELIRRRLKVIIVCDADADPNSAFEDLSNAIEKIRTDFGALIDIKCPELEQLTPQETHYDNTRYSRAVKYAKCGYFKAKITYHKSPLAKNNEGTLIYINTTMVKDLASDLYGYHKARPEFPEEPTSDQFFDEKQFEAYRELGFQLARKMMLDKQICSESNIKNYLGVPAFDPDEENAWTSNIIP